jgi:acetyl esterase/lipase
MKSPHSLLLMTGLGVLLALPLSAQQPPATPPGKPPPLTTAQKAERLKADMEKLIGQLSAGSAHFQDIVYVDQPQPGVDPDSSQTLDLFVPPGNGPFPLIVWIHGGGWHGGGKETSGIGFAKLFLPKGFAVATLNYRYVLDAHFPAQIDDCDAALVWLRKHAAQYHLDPDRVGVLGHSAGAHLAALMAVTGDGAQFSHDPVSVRVQAAVCWATPADLDRDRGNWPAKSIMFNPKDPLFKFYPNGVYDSAFARMASPASYVHASVPPMLILHGGKDDLVPIGQAQAFADNLKKAGVDVTFRIDPERGHLVGSEAANQDAIAFFQRTLMPSVSATK